MTNEMQVLGHWEICGSRFTIYGTVEDPMFRAKEVAERIEHSNATEMARSVDADEKLNSVIFSSGQRREVMFLTEYGLYEVLMQSRKPVAKQFKRRVKEILRELRRKGRYEVPRANGQEQPPVFGTLDGVPAMTVGEAAECLGVTIGAIRRVLKPGAAFRDGRDYVFGRTVAAKYKKQNPNMRHPNCFYFILPSGMTKLRTRFCHTTGPRGGVPALKEGQDTTPASSAPAECEAEQGPRYLVTGKAEYEEALTRLAAVLELIEIRKAWKGSGKEGQERLARLESHIADVTMSFMSYLMSLWQRRACRAS